MELTAREVANAVRGRVAGDDGALARSFTMDTRRLERGGCFVALPAERDGHTFVDDAFARGASVVMTAGDATPPSGAAVVRVDDAWRALAALGSEARRRLDAATVVGVTGSAGKTTTKDLVAAALGTTWRVHASPVSFNNEAGVPLTLLGAPTDTEAVVVEMGARFRGNIAALCEIAAPSVGVITNIGLAHVGLLEGREGVARTKGELLEALPADGLAVLDAADDFTPELRERTQARVLLVGLTGDDRADVVATGVHVDDELRAHFEVRTPWGVAPVHLGLRGEHQITNALMAAAVAGALGVPIEVAAAGLARAEAAPWRMELLRSRTGVVVLNDAYNASPTSTAAALRALARLGTPGRRIAVLGEMRELGPEADTEHALVGRLAAELGIDTVVAVGDAAASVARGARGAAGVGAIEVVEVGDAAGARAAVLERVGPGDAVLVKASRLAGLERVAEALTGVAVDA
jgi:UDP-N-acetylmuramoyl-tripeptide--D-alanyl-D-alanine ligase